MDRLKQGYVQEIEYQKRMINNIKKYLKISIILSACAFTSIMLAKSLPLKILSIVLLVISMLLIFILGLAIHNGYKNVNKVIDDYESQMKQQA
ncbi:MAG: hypothetical protein Q4C49_01775 [Bacillota bacterium]|nr:hypothetical protein [Bacillota bacterium]